MCVQWVLWILLTFSLRYGGFSKLFLIKWCCLWTYLSLGAHWKQNMLEPSSNLSKYSNLWGQRVFSGMMSPPSQAILKKACLLPAYEQRIYPITIPQNLSRIEFQWPSSSPLVVPGNGPELPQPHLNLRRMINWWTELVAQGLTSDA